MSTLLRIKDLTVTFGNLQALHGVNMDLAAGEIRALCGENGAGKSTLIKAVMGIHQPDAGIIELDGSACRVTDPQEAQALGFAMVAQELSLAPALSVLDNIWLGSKSVPAFYRRAFLRDKARSALDLLQVDIGLDEIVGNLSIGQRQIVEIARMLARDARMLILDEPTATLSDVDIEHLFAVLRRLRDNGHAILYVTHRLGEVFDLCDSVTVLRNGRHVCTDSVAQLGRDRLVEAMLGRSVSEMYPPPLGNSERQGGLTVKNLRVPGVCQSVSFEAQRGKVICLAGQIGSGAGTVIRAIAGLIPSSVGEICLDGRPLTRKKRRSFVGFISEDRAQEGLFNRSVLENLMAAQWEDHSRFGMIKWSSVHRRAGELAGSVGIDKNRLAANAFTLSGGNQQKLLFARAAGGVLPGLILMIEPTRGVDVGARAEIYRLMRQLCARGYSLVMTSTDLEEVVGVADVVLPMYRGKIISIYEGAAIDIAEILLDITHPRDAPEVISEAISH